jgi:hypothetical protein
MRTSAKAPRCRVIAADRIRTIGQDGFAFIPNQFLNDGFFASLEADELLLYFLLVLAGDRRGMSHYHFESICQILRWPVERYLSARNSLMAKDLIAFDGARFQVLALPAHAPTPTPLHTQEQLEANDPATIRVLAQRSLGLAPVDSHDVDNQA